MPLILLFKILFEGHKSLFISDAPVWNSDDACPGFYISLCYKVVK